MARKKRTRWTEDLPSHQSQSATPRRLHVARAVGAPRAAQRRLLMGRKRLALEECLRRALAEAGGQKPPLQTTWACEAQAANARATTVRSQREPALRIAAEVDGAGELVELKVAPHDAHSRRPRARVGEEAGRGKTAGPGAPPPTPTPSGGAAATAAAGGAFRYEHDRALHVSREHPKP